MYRQKKILASFLRPVFGKLIFITDLCFAAASHNRSHTHLGTLSVSEQSVRLTLRLSRFFDFRAYVCRVTEAEHRGRVGTLSLIKLQPIVSVVLIWWSAIDNEKSTDNQFGATAYKQQWRFVFPEDDLCFLFGCSSVKMSQRY